MAVKDDSWTVTTLKECARWYSGGTPNTSIAEYWNGDIPWITASSLHDFYIKDSERRVTHLGIANGTRLIPKDTILFIVRGMSLKTEFRVGITRRPMAFGQDCKALVAKDGVDPLFLANVLRAKSEEILGFVDEASHGTGRLATDALEKLEILFPPLAEQKAIAHILGTLDDKIELNQQTNQTLEAIARALFKSWFIDFDPVRAKLDGRQPAGMDAETAALFPAEFEDGRAIGKIPKGWKVQIIGDVIEFAYGKPLKQPDRQHGIVPVYGSNGQIGWHNKSLVKAPGIVIGRKGNPGTVVWTPIDFYPIDTTFYAIPISSTKSLHYLFHALCLQDLPSLAADSAVPGLNRNLAYMNKLLIPSEECLEAFDSIVNGISAKVHITNQEAITLTSIRDALLPKLLSGEIRVQDAEKVVEAVT